MNLPDKLVEQVFDFEMALVDHFLESIPIADFGDAPLLNLVISADVSSQEFVSVTNQTEVRRLQMQLVKVSVVVNYKFKSVQSREKEDIEALIGDSLSNDIEKQVFVDRLVDRDAVFFSSASVEKVEVEGVEPEAEQLLIDPAVSGEPNLVYIVIGASGGGLLALMSLGVLAFRRRSLLHSIGSPEDVEAVKSIKTATQPETLLGVASEVVFERQDDISTLDDPVVGVVGMSAANSVRDEQTASIGNDYDYTKQYLRAQGLSSLGDSGELSRQLPGSSFSPTSSSRSSGQVSKVIGPAVASFFSDEGSYDQEYARDSVEQRFEVVVPPGKLGMVIDTPGGIAPVVHAIKPDSILASAVIVGDHLLSVDGEDVTYMTAVQVSKLISLKADQQRTMEFVRRGVVEAENSSSQLRDTRNDSDESY